MKGAKKQEKKQESEQEEDSLRSTQLMTASSQYQGNSQLHFTLSPRFDY
jgi:hypothetical protein